MASAFPNATVTGFEHLVPAMSTDPKDRHVAAAAVRGGAALIVTANTRDFPPEALARYDIEVIHPDDFLQDQLDLAGATVLTCLQQHRSAYTRPQFTVTECYLGLERTVPAFARAAIQAELSQAGHQPGDPLPIEIRTGDEAFGAFFPDGEPTPDEPRGAAFIWWEALRGKAEFLDVLHALTLDPSLWDDYNQAEEILRDHGMMQFPERCPGDDDIAYIKFMPNAEHAAVAFATTPIYDAKILTLLRCADGIWRVWGLSPSRFPSADEVRGS
ncbi:hypothetical protein [Mycolicibacterium baixiangningiae]|uniref:hypothetical protein n=1 Tax=Mycolicibacterium baixiangningiae TaxID=2761578 RepID=UPI0018686198|nr:hypothetical protein [Mycolicibacterium baixiangningiae]